MKTIPPVIVCFLFLAVFILEAAGYVGNTGRIGEIDILLEQPPKIEALDRAVTVTTRLTNRGGEAVSVRLAYKTIDTIEFVDAEAGDRRRLEKTIDVPAGKSIDVKTDIVARKGTYNAHYPVSLTAEATVDGKKENVWTIHPVETAVGPNPDWSPEMTWAEKVVKPWPKETVSGQKTTAVEGLDFDLGKNRRCDVAFGPKGILDGTIRLTLGDRAVVFHGIRIWVDGKPMIESVDKAPTAEPDDSGKRWRYDISVGGKNVRVFFGVRHDREAVRFSVFSPEPGLITAIEFGPADQTADRVYFGHGYLVERPGSFNTGGGGHHLSTSHVGFDFENDISLVMATATFPEFLRVDPGTKLYTLSVRPETTFTLLPGDRNEGGAPACAIRYRQYTDKKPAPGVSSKAGRFVVDIWNGLYKDHAELIRRAADYGLRDDLIFISHNWQRYKYDHRLPDVWPPNPLFGTTNDMKSVMKSAHDHGWLFGVHLNCIDYYPDSSVFTFDDVVFRPGGDPQKAYLNVMLDAQSYRLRPDRAAEVLDQSVREMLAEFPLSAVFVDVLASASPQDFFDRKGRFHSRLQTRDGWKGVFALLRERLKAAGPAPSEAVGKRPEKNPDGNPIVYPTISEAGSDSLAGQLDGSDCQLMFLTRETGENRWLRIPKFDDWTNVPWFDLVNHTNFSLHGVGYSIRFEGGRGRELHGIDSDDYISTEILFGHALMVDGDCRDVKEILGGTLRHIDVAEALRSTVRKYRLAQPVARRLADANIETFEPVDGNIHRQKIVWSDGTVVHVNRGDDDWSVDGVVLPRYGYRAKNTTIGLDSAICRLDGQVVERTFTKDGKESTFYVNGRNTPMPHLIPATPAAAGFEHVAGARFRLPLRFSVLADMPTKDYRLRLHLVKRKSTEAGSGPDAVLGEVLPERPVSRWKDGETVFATKSRHGDSDGEVEAAMEFSVPDDFPKGVYDLLISAGDPEHPDDVHRRGRFFGAPSFWRRYHLGRLTVDRENGNVKSLAFEPAKDEDASLYQRLVPPERAVDFGVCRTKAGLFIETDPEAKRVTVTPLPGEKAARVELKVPDFATQTGQAVRGEVLDASGRSLRPLEIRMESSRIVFETTKGDFAYRLLF